MTVEVRPAGEDDFWPIAVIHVRSWQLAYAGIVPQAVLDGLDPAARHRRLVDRAADPANDGEWLVATREGTVTGFAAIGPWRDSSDVPAGDGAGEIRAIYVDPRLWRHGIGAALMDRAVARLDQLGHAAQRLWVLEANARGREFYESAGWYFDGARQDYLTGGAALPEVRYARGGAAG
jgi:GNAT superfamily N-acetyltransferase